MKLNENEYEPISAEGIDNPCGLCVFYDDAKNDCANKSNVNFPCMEFERWDGQDVYWVKKEQ